MMRSPFRVFILFTVSILAADSTDELISNLITSNGQTESPAPDQFHQPIVSPNSPADSPNTNDQSVNTDTPTSLTGSINSLEALDNLNNQAGSASQNVALAPTVLGGSAEIIVPTLDNTITADDHSTNPATSSTLIPSQDLVFDWRLPPIDCEPPYVVGCCEEDHEMWFCNKLGGEPCRNSLKCCGKINEDHQCVNEKKTVQQDEGVDSVQQVGPDVQGSKMTQAERERYLRDKKQAEANKKKGEQRLRELAEAKLRKEMEDQQNNQEQFFQESGDEVRDNAKNDPNWDGLGSFFPGWLQEWVEDNSH